MSRRVSTVLARSNLRVHLPFEHRKRVAPGDFETSVFGDVSLLEMLDGVPLVRPRVMEERPLETAILCF